MDSRLAAARVHHRLASENVARAKQNREARDQIIRTVYAEGGWSYASLARTTGLSEPTVAKIIKPQSR